MKAIYPTQGTDGPTKTDEFSEKFQTTFDPPPTTGNDVEIRDSPKVTI